MSLQITLPWPPSVNQYWRHVSTGPCAGRVLVSAEGRSYRQLALQAVLMQRAVKRLEGRLRVHVLAYPPNRQKRDLDNLAKSLLDAMTHAGVYGDDSQIDDLRIQRARDERGELILGAKVLVSIEEVGELCA